MTYKEVETQKEYRLLLDDIMKESKELVRKFPEVIMYKSILDQVLDIYEVIKKNKKLSEDQIYSRYTLGNMAVKNFDTEHELYGRKLEDIFGGLFEYFDMPSS